MLDRFARIIACMGALTAALAPSTATPAPRRIVSLNLCVDQYLLALADRRQVAGLTSFARDPALSAYATRAARWPVNRGGAEDVLSLRPDLILVAPGRRADTMALLRGRGIAIVEVPEADSYADIVEQTRRVADVIGQRARGERLIARMNARLARVPVNAGGGRVAAYYQRRGYLTGTGTLVDDLMRRVGLVNLAGKLGKPVLAQVPLEEMVAARPDWLIVESATDRVADQGTEMLHHPALASIPRISIPQSWTVCGGPAYVRAARALTARLNVR
jgi:iron complex transport system substrate-binding protein